MALCAFCIISTWVCVCSICCCYFCHHCNQNHGIAQYKPKLTIFLYNAYRSIKSAGYAWTLKRKLYSGNKNCEHGQNTNTAFLLFHSGPSVENIATLNTHWCTCIIVLKSPKNSPVVFGFKAFYFFQPIIIMASASTIVKFFILGATAKVE